MPHTYEYPMQSVTVDAVIFAVSNGKLRQFMIERGKEPYVNQMALPGGHVDPNEDLIDACTRELKEETRLVLANDLFVQTGAYGTPYRDPRGHYVTVAYACIVPYSLMLQHVGEGEDDAKTILINDRPLDKAEYAFDHSKISMDALECLGNHSKRDVLDFTLRHKFALGETFTSRHLRELHQVVRQEDLDAGNFTKLVKNWETSGYIGVVGESKTGYKGTLYSFI